MTQQDPNPRAPRAERPKRASARRGAAPATTQIGIAIVGQNKDGKKWAYFVENGVRYRVRAAGAKRGAPADALRVETFDQAGHAWAKVPKSQEQGVMYFVARLAIMAVLGGV